MSRHILEIDGDARIIKVVDLFGADHRVLVQLLIFWLSGIVISSFIGLKRGRCAFDLSLVDLLRELCFKRLIINEVSPVTLLLKLFLDDVIQAD